MNKPLCKALLLVMLTSVSCSVIAENPTNARQLLEQMATAMRELSYQGTFVYVRDGVVETMRITHISDENGVRERLYSVNGPRREVIRDRKGVRCVLKDSAAVEENPVVADSYFPELPQTLFDDEASGYRLGLGGEARIAGQTARRVSISPEDDYRYGYDFWLEKETGLLLKWVLFDAKHKALAKLMFTDLALGADVDSSELKSDSPAEDFVALRTISPAKSLKVESKPRWQPNKLPPGFLLASHSRKIGSDGVFEHLVYSDGLAAVSVYIEKQGGEQALALGNSQMGTNNVYSRKQGDLQITVIGEVPAITVKSIANEMAYSVASN